MLAILLSLSISNINNLNGFELYAGIIAGINNLRIYKNKLDEINVFPVPDGDTGTNMCFTLLPIVEECEVITRSDILTYS